MITLDKLIKEEKKFYKQNKKLPTKLHLTIEDYNEFKTMMGYELKKIHGMVIVISNKNGIE